MLSSKTGVSSKVLALFLAAVLVAGLLPSGGVQQAFAGESQTKAAASQVDQCSELQTYASVPSKVTALNKQSEARKLLSMVNAERSKYKAASLGWNTDLEKSAKQRAAELAFNFSHTRPDGSNCKTAFPSGTSVYGENIAYGFTAASAVNKQWINSSSHHKNMIDGRFKSFASACVVIKGTTYWVELFTDKAPTGMKGAANDSSQTYSLPQKSSLSKASISLSSSYVAYSGKAQTPKVTVKMGSKTLKSGTDYTVLYKNNKMAGTATVTVTGKGTYAGSVSKSFAITPNVQYYVHRQTYGWEAKYSKKDGASSGTTGQRKRLEGIYVRLANKPVSGSIQYRTHVQKQGWEKGWRSEGQMSGTTGKRYRLEAIQIRLTGEMAKRYDVYYRVHAQKLGWMGWAKNGASAGTAGYAYRLESIQIKLVPKGGAAPTSAGGVASTKGKAAFSEKK